MKDFSFGNINIASKKQSLNLKIMSNPLLLDRSDAIATYDFVPVVLVEDYYDDYQLKAIEAFLKSVGLHKFKIIVSINCIPNQKVIEKIGVIKFYTINRINMENYIEKHVPIITVGPALYSILRENDIYPNHVQQCIFGKTNFWFSPDLTNASCHKIFPIETFKDIFAKGFKKPVDSFKTKLAQIQINNVIKTGGKLPPRYPKLKKHFITSKEDFIETFYNPNKNRHDEVLAYDLETGGFNFLSDKIGCITLSFDGIEGYYIPWRYVDKEKLNEIIGNNKNLGANLKFDVKFLWQNGIKNARIDEDVITIGHVLDETRSNSLKSLAFYYSEYGGYERELDLYKSKVKNINYLDIDEDILKEYAIMDAIVTYRVWKNEMKHMRELDKKYPSEINSWTSLESYYYTRRIPANNLYAGIEYRGCYVDKPRLDALRKELSSYIEDLRNKLTEAFHVSKYFDWNSSMKVGKLLEERGWEDLGRTESGEYQVSDFQLKRWAKDHPEANLIKEYKSNCVTMNSFIGDEGQGSIINEYLADTYGEIASDDEAGTKGWSQYLRYHPEDNSYRMHADYYPMGTDSGRTRCQKPNLQNTPTRGKFAHAIKRCLKTPDDDNYYSVTVDYSALQMRLATIDSCDKNLTELFKRPDADAHSRTAWLTFCSEKTFDVMNVDVEQNGKHYHYLGGEQVFTKRGYILARDLKEDDEIIDG